LSSSKRRANDFHFTTQPTRSKLREVRKEEGGKKNEKEKSFGD
jgi:hypothetical protein